MRKAIFPGSFDLLWYDALTAHTWICIDFNKMGYVIVKDKIGPSNSLEF